MTFLGFGEPTNVLGTSGFSYEISFGNFWRDIGYYGFTPTYGYKPPQWLIDLSVGGGVFSGDISEYPGLGLPPLDAEIADQEEIAFPVEIDLRDEPPIPKPVPEIAAELPPEILEVAQPTFTATEFTDPETIQYFIDIGYRIIYQYAVATPANPEITSLPDQPEAAGPPTPEIGSEEEEDMSWFDDTYESIDERYFGGYLPGGAPIGGGAPPSTPVTYDNTGGGTGPPPPPNGGVVAGACGPVGPQPVWKKVCGVYKWVLPKRRRKRALATKGDLSQLAALKGILGGGKAFEVWIATHS